MGSSPIGGTKFQTDKFNLDMIWFIVILLYVIVGILTYKYIINKCDNTKFEKVWFSCVWIALIPLYIIHLVHNRKN